MKTKYAGQLIKIYREDGTYYSIIPKEDFEPIFKKYSRNKAEKLGISHVLYNRSANYHYKPNEIEEVRVDKMKSTNAEIRYTMWDNYLKNMEKVSPGISKLFKDSLKTDPGLIMDELERLSDMFYETKIFIYKTKKYIRQACIRKGVEYKKMVNNTLEYKVKKLLKDMGYNPKVQPYINKHWFDFEVDGFLIEVDGKSFHTQEKDSIKDKIAKKNGYTLIRVQDIEVDDVVKLKKRLEKCLQVK